MFCRCDCAQQPLCHCLFFSAIYCLCRHYFLWLRSLICYYLLCHLYYFHYHLFAIIIFASSFIWDAFADAIAEPLPLIFAFWAFRWLLIFWFSPCFRDGLCHLRLFSSWCHWWYAIITPFSFSAIDTAALSAITPLLMACWYIIFAIIAIDAYFWCRHYYLRLRHCFIDICHRWYRLFSIFSFRRLRRHTLILRFSPPPLSSPPLRRCHCRLISLSAYATDMMPVCRCCCYAYLSLPLYCCFHYWCWCYFFDAPVSWYALRWYLPPLCYVSPAPQEMIRCRRYADDAVYFHFSFTVCHARCRRCYADMLARCRITISTRRRWARAYFTPRRWARRCAISAPLRRRHLFSPPPYAALLAAAITLRHWWAPDDASRHYFAWWWCRACRDIDSYRLKYWYFFFDLRHYATLLLPMRHCRFLRHAILFSMLIIEAITPLIFAAPLLLRWFAIEAPLIRHWCCCRRWCIFVAMLIAADRAGLLIRCRLRCRRCWYFIFFSLRCFATPLRHLLLISFHLLFSMMLPLFIGFRYYFLSFRRCRCLLWCHSDTLLYWCFAMIFSADMSPML